MPVPSPRNAIKPARGNYSDLAANIASLSDGEICYAIDQDRLYVNEAGTLVAVSAGVLGDLSDVSLSSLAEGDALIYDGSNWVNGGVMNGGNF